MEIHPIGVCLDGCHLVAKDVKLSLVGGVRNKEVARLEAPEGGEEGAAQVLPDARRVQRTNDHRHLLHDSAGRRCEGRLLSADEKAIEKKWL